MSEKKTRQKTAIVIGTSAATQHARQPSDNPTTGAGAGGIATAARLAKAGFKVTVVEKNDFTGGRCSLIHHDGYVGSLLLPSRSPTGTATAAS